MRFSIIGWFYGFDSKDSFSLRIFKSIISMFLVYSIGVLAYLLFIHGFMEYSWLSLASILFPIIFSWYAGVDIFLKNPESVKSKREYPKRYILRSIFVGVLLYIIWLALTILVFDTILQS